MAAVILSSSSTFSPLSPLLVFFSYFITTATDVHSFWRYDLIIKQEESWNAYYNPILFHPSTVSSLVIHISFSLVHATLIIILSLFSCSIPLPVKIEKVFYFVIGSPLSLSTSQFFSKLHEKLFIYIPASLIFSFSDLLFLAYKLTHHCSTVPNVYILNCVFMA